jgi:hypothetical protein
MASETVAYIILMPHTFDRFSSACIKVRNQKDELQCPLVFVYGDVKE